MLGVHVDPEEARMTPTPVDQLETALETAEALIAAITPEQWSRPTPCTDWDVRALVTHLSGGNHLFAAALADDASSRAREPAGLAEDDDLVADYRNSAQAVLAAFRRPGALQRMVEVPFGTVPGGVALHLRLTEVLVHGWDLARATGQVADFPEDLAEQELAFTRDALGAVPPGRSPFAPPTPAPDTAPALDRLAACLGRRLPDRDGAPAHPG
jgi:uncharacterized protein (TIGR03086 family)